MALVSYGMQRKTTHVGFNKTLSAKTEFFVLVLLTLHTGVNGYSLQVTTVL